MKEKLRAYFTFTKKERLGVVVLLIIIIILFLLPYWIRRPPGSEDPEATRRFAPLLNSQKTDSGQREAVERYRPDNAPLKASVENREGRGQPATLFAFDPNVLGEADWQRLGLTERQSRTLVHYTEKGGRFRSPSDLEKIYGLSAADRDRLMPYVRIPSPSRYPGKREGGVVRDRPYPGISRADTRQEKFSFAAYYRREEKPGRTAGSPPGFALTQRYFPRKHPVPIGINRADSAAWEQLPGIGEKLAARIVRFRERLGGFYDIAQVGETFGLPDSVFQIIKPWLSVDSVALQRIDINRASAETLRQHPYIRWKLANLLLRYRDQHGKFESLDDLGQLEIPEATLLEKLKPYLRLE